MRPALTGSSARRSGRAGVRGADGSGGDGHLEAAPGLSGAFAARVLLAVLPLQLAFGLVFAWGAAAPYILQQARWSPLLVGAVFSATPLGYGLGMLAGGALADRLPPRRICWTGLTLMAVGMAVAFLFPAPATFIVFYSWLGLGIAGGVAMGGSVAAGAYAFPSRVGTVGGAITACYAAAGLVQLPLVAQLSATIGWLGALRTAAIGSLLLGAVFLLLMPGVPAPRRPHDAERLTLGQVFARRRVWTGFAIQAFASSLGAFTVVNIGVYAREHGLPAGVATLALTVAAAGNVAGRLSAGAGADRAGADRVLLLILVLNLVATVVFAAGVSGVAPVLIAAVATGIGFGGAAGVMSRAGAAAAPPAPNTSFGILFAGYALGAFAGPLTGAAVGGGELAWVVVGAPSLLGLAVLGLRTRAGDPVRG